MSDSLKSLFAAAARVTIKDTFGSNGMGLTVEVQTVPKSELEDITRRCTRKVKEKNPDGTAEWKSIVDRDKLHAWLFDHIVSLEGLTVGKALALANRVCPDEHRARAVAWDPQDEGCKDTVLFLLKDARLEVDGVTQSFEDFVWTRIAKAAEEHAAAEVAAKNA